MAAPATIDEFLDLVRKSGVTDEKRLDGYLQKLRASNALPREPAKFAGLLIRDGYLTQFQAEHILRGKWKRFSIGKYRVLERLGSGGMGAVYLCEHKLMRRRVAVKVLPANKAQDESALKRFEREARAAAALDHPNIVHAYDIDQDEDLHFLVMEYVDGASLQDIVKKSGPMDPIRAASYIRQASLGLEHAHNAGLIHRDIKPGNILVDRTGVVKILDMGLARFFHDEDDNLTRKFDENVLGTADYLAPEQAVDSHDVDIRADIYSMGATFYYCLTGRPPFGDGTVAQKLIWHQTKQPKPLLQLRPDTPENLVAIIEKMMSKDPNQRYQRPGEIYEALGAVTEGATSAPPKTAEMPALSPAVRTGPVDTEQATIVSQVAPAGPVSPAPRPTSSVVPLRAPASSRANLQVSATQQVTAVPPPPPRRRSEPEETWAVDTESPIALADTERGGESLRLRKAAEAELVQRRQWLIYLGVVSFFAILVFVAAYFMLVPKQLPPEKREPVLRVSRDIKSIPGKNLYTSLQSALSNAEKNDTIEIWDMLLEENVSVDPKKVINTQVTLKAAPGVQVVWKSKDKSGKTPLLQLTNAKDFHIDGQGITLNGELSGADRVEDLIRMSFKCQGLVLQGLRARSFGRSAIAISNCAGEEANPIKILHFQVIDSGGKKPDCAIRFSAASNAQPRINDHIVIDDTCQFLGIPADKIFKIEDPIGMGTNIRLPKTAAAPAQKTTAPNAPPKK